MKCPNCRSEWGEFVQENSFFLRCLNCQTEGPATSFSEFSETLNGSYEAFLVIDNKSKLLFSGDIREITSNIEIEASKGKLIMIKKNIRQ
jgi:hypothetical protein